MKKEVIAETFTPFYDQLEDRIKLIINYQNIEKRVDLMITRAFIINFIPAFDDYLLQYYPEKALESQSNNFLVNPTKKDQKIAKETTAKKTNEKEESKITKTDNANMKLLEKEPELLIKLDFIFDKKSQKTTLIFTTKKSIVKTALTYTMMKQLISTIKAAIPNFSWGIAQNF